MIKKSIRRPLHHSLFSTSSLIALATGAASWSGLANATSERAVSGIPISPTNYSVIEDGSVIVKLKTGDKLRLDANQFVTLEDGSLIVANEINLASSHTLLGPKSQKTLTPSSDEQGTPISHTEIAGSTSQLASIFMDPTLGQSGPAGLERYELAQAGIESVKGAGEGLQAGLTVLPLSMLLLDMLTAKDQQGQTEENT